MGSTIRILVVIPFAFHRESGSSLSSYYRVLALSEIVSKVDVITTPHGKDLYKDNVKIARTPSHRLFKTYQPGAYIKRLVYEVFLLLKSIEFLFKNNYDLVFIHGSSIYWAFVLQAFYNVPFIAMVHGNIQTELEKWGISKNSFLKKHLGKLECYVINTFAYIIAEHEAVKSILINGGVNEVKITVIKICVKSVPQIKKKSTSKYFTLLYTGTFVKIQNIDLLYQTARLLKGKNIRFQIIGGIEKELKEERKKIQDYDIADMVDLFPRVDQKDLNGYMEQADIVVSPRIFGDDTPMKIFDYLNYGKCILASNRPIHTGILNCEVACLFEPDPESLAHEVLSLVINPSRIADYEKNAKKYFEDNFKLEKMIGEYKGILQVMNSEDIS